MDMSEAQIERWLERGSKFFRATARNPVVRETLFGLGLTDEELSQGWSLYSQLHGFGGEVSARAATRLTSAAQAMNEIDAWDAPAYAAARAVLEGRAPQVAAFLFENLEASRGIEAVTGAERFLDRIALLRDGRATNVEPEAGRQAVQLLATRKILEPVREKELRALIDVARRGARPEEVVAAPARDARRQEIAQGFVTWLHEWREVARAAIARRDYRISLGLAQRRQASDDDSTDVPVAGRVHASAKA